MVAWNQLAVNQLALLSLTCTCSQQTSKLGEVLALACTFVSEKEQA